MSGSIRTDDAQLAEDLKLCREAVSSIKPGSPLYLRLDARRCLGLIEELIEARARLVPTPPQAAPGAVDVVLDPPKRDKDCGDCTRLAICNGELACLCGPTSKMFDRKAPDYPLQPEERRVGPDEVVVPRSAAEYAIRAFDWIECPDSEHYEAWRAFLDALRTSAQDHNGEGAK